MLVESTYGDRDHDADDDGEQLAQVIRDTVERGGKLIIPAFAIGRVEEVLYWVRRLEQERRIPVLPVYVDSPMATEALKFYTARVSELDPDMRPTREGRLDVCDGAVPDRRLAAAVEGADGQPRAAIVISSSGMATGGRVLHHMAAALPDPRNTVLFVGYQAAGTRGRQLVDGAREVRIHGQSIPVNARDRQDRLDVGARRSRRDPALARHAAGRARRAVSRARRARADGRAQDPRSATARLDRRDSAAPRAALALKS